MHPNSVRLLTVAAILLIFTCGTAVAWEKNVKQVAIPGGVVADRLPYPQSEGAKLFAQYCSKCHNLPSPRMHSSSDWPMRFEKMMDHAVLMAGTAPDIKMPTGDEKATIISYLQKNGFAGVPGNAPVLGEQGAFNVVWFCSACHAVPDPAQFSAKEWRKIVERMNTYRKRQGRDVMSNSDKKAIVAFLGKKRP